MILHNNAAGNRRGLALKPASLRACARPGAVGSSGRQARECLEAPDGSVALPGRSGKVAGSFGGIPEWLWETSCRVPPWDHPGRLGGTTGGLRPAYDTTRRDSNAKKAKLKAKRRECEKSQIESEKRKRKRSPLSHAEQVGGFIH